VASVNKFLRIGDGIDFAKGTRFDPLRINTTLLSVGLRQGEYVVNVNKDGSYGVSGGKTLPQGWPRVKKTVPVPVPVNVIVTVPKPVVVPVPVVVINLGDDVKQKCRLADKLNRDTYWYYIQNATLSSTDTLTTTDRYYCQFVYKASTGSYLSISYWDLNVEVTTINTFVRLGDYRTDTGVNGAHINLLPTYLNLKDCQP
jgi:hypothetical protein